MSGRIVHVGHTCERPPASAHTEGTIWQCDYCRRYWRVVLGRWEWISPMAIAFMRAGAELAREFKRSAESDR